MTEYWLISAPGDKTCQQTWETMNNLTSKQNSLSMNYKFHIPDLKVGTLDQLVGLSDDLGKLDTYVEQVTRKVACYLGEVLEDQRDKLHENLMANNSQTSVDGEAESAEGGSGDGPEGGGGPDTPPNTPVTPSSYKPVALKEQHHHHHHHHHHQPPASRHWSRDASTLTAGDEPTAAAAAAATACLGQQQHQRHHTHPHQHHHHHHHHHHNHHHHHTQHQHHHHHQHHSDEPTSHQPKKWSSSSQGGGDSSSMYSCYQAHWCGGAAAASSTPSTPSPRHSPSPRSPSSLSCSSSCSENRSNDNQTPSSSCSSADEAAAAAADHEQPQEPGSRRRRERGRRRRHHRQRQRRPRPPRPRTASPEDRLDADDDSIDQDQDQAAGKLPNPGDLPTYITRFQWDMAKYPIKQSLRNIADIISKQVGQIDADLKTKSTTYNNLKGSLQNLEKKQTGSLLTRNLADLVKKEHFILDSEYLTTLLVIVPRASFQEWNAIYEKLTDMIVPRSSQLITQDQEYGLYTVTLFKKVIEEFKLHAREKKFIVRDFTYNEEELAAGKNEMTKLVTDKKKQFGPLVRWLKVNFSECFCAWIHVKALRVFVESVLRYGLPVNFQAILLRPNKKSTKRLRDVLNQLYAHLDSSATAGGSQSSNQDSVDIPGLGFGQSDYFPYVYYKINVDMVDNKV